MRRVGGGSHHAPITCLYAPLSISISIYLSASVSSDCTTIYPAKYLYILSLHLFIGACILTPIKIAIKRFSTLRKHVKKGIRSPPPNPPAFERWFDLDFFLCVFGRKVSRKKLPCSGKGGSIQRERGCLLWVTYIQKKISSSFLYFLRLLRL